MKIILTSVRIGASRQAQIIDNVGMLSDIKFGEEELQKIEEICKG